MTLTLIFLILALFLLSVFLLWKFDRSRLWDHFARTLVQVAVATATVAVAITIFEKQLSERDAQTLQQQRWVISSYLRSKIMEATADYRKKSTLIESRLYECDDSIQDCTVYPERIVYGLREKLAGYEQSPSQLDFSINTNRNDVWQILRSSPLIKEDIFNKLLALLDQYDRDWSLAHVSIVFTLADYRREKQSYEQGLVPAGSLQSYDTKFEELQAREVEAALKAICKMSDLINELNGGQSRPAQAITDNSEICPPFSDAFARFFDALKAPPSQRLPPEWLTEGGKKIDAAPKNQQKK